MSPSLSLAPTSHMSRSFCLAPHLVEADGAGDRNALGPSLPHPTPHNVRPRFVDDTKARERDWEPVTLHRVDAS
eukprot:1784677-Rhodomonas_salina.1